MAKVTLSRNMDTRNDPKGTIVILPLFICASTFSLRAVTSGSLMKSVCLPGLRPFG